MKVISCSLLLCLLLCSCSNKYYRLVYHDKLTEIVKVKGNVSDIKIIDTRDHKDERELQYPGTLSLPGYKDYISPMFTDDYNLTIERTVRWLFTGEGEKYKVICMIRNAYQENTLHFLKEGVYAAVELSVSIYDENDELLDRSESMIDVGYKGGHVGKQYIHSVFKKTLRMALYDCFDNFNFVATVRTPNTISRNIQKIDK